VVWWCGGVVVWWCGGVVVWWCGGVVVWLKFVWAPQPVSCLLPNDGAPVIYLKPKPHTAKPPRYPFDIPTEAFPFERFRQAFAAVQASVVHLQVGGGWGLCGCVVFRGGSLGAEQH
jgi:hypothetical protein